MGSKDKKSSSPSPPPPVRSGRSSSPSPDPAGTSRSRSRTPASGSRAPGPPGPPGPPPPPPPPPPPALTTRPGPKPPTLPTHGPPGALLVELWIYDSRLFKKHWAYRVVVDAEKGLGVLVHAIGDPRQGFKLQFKRHHDTKATGNLPLFKIPLQWVDGHCFDDPAMFPPAFKIEWEPRGLFEKTAAKAPAPGPSLNDSTDPSTRGRKVVQRNCQTWIAESSTELVKGGIFKPEVAAYLYALKD